MEPIADESLELRERVLVEIRELGAAVVRWLRHDGLSRGHEFGDGRPKVRADPRRPRVHVRHERRDLAELCRQCLEVVLHAHERLRDIALA